MNKVFTFWEPKAAVPGYIRLCMKTWEKNLAGYETVVLDYGNLGDYLSEEEIAAVVDKRMTFAMQSDCIRCAVLRRNGGIWLDADTVLTKPLDGRFSAAETTMIARRDDDGRFANYGAFINAPKPGAKFLDAWYEELTGHVALAREFRASALKRLFRRREWRNIRRWDWCVNAIIDPIADKWLGDGTAAKGAYAYVDKRTIGALPEEDLTTGGDLDRALAYMKYWFEPGDPAAATKNCAGILMLHNSWTPAKFLAMSEDEFAASDTRLAALIRGQMAK